VTANDAADAAPPPVVRAPPGPRARPPSPAPILPSEMLTAIQQAVAQAVVGHDETVRLLTAALAADGHVLLEGVPGLAKTFLVRRFAQSLALSFKRIQFTPDMLPSDIIGTVVLNPASQSFEYRRGPIFANVILADEINRAPPKVQSALLESMQERQVTVEGTTYPLPKPFIVIATQNPIEQEGTYPLPEAELDRFLFRVLLDYPLQAEEVEILRQHSSAPDVPPTVTALTAELLDELRQQALDVTVADDVLGYVVGIVRSTRTDSRIVVGASPRAGVQFLRAAKAAAMFAGRGYVTPDDVKSLAFWVLNHRLVLAPEVIAQQYTSGRAGTDAVLRDLVKQRLDQVKVPR
jgi:MoxR-like ATPase